MSSTFAIAPERSYSFPAPQYCASDRETHSNVVDSVSSQIQWQPNNFTQPSSNSRYSNANSVKSSSFSQVGGNDLRDSGYLEISKDRPTTSQSPDEQPAFWNGKTSNQQSNPDNYFSPRNRFWSNNDLCVRSIENRRTSEMKELQSSLRDAMDDKQACEERCEELEFEVVALEQQARHFKERCEFLERIIRRHGIDIRAEEDEHRRRDSAYSETESIADESPENPD